MIGIDYTPGLLADLAEIPVTPGGQRVTSYTDDWVCKTTLFDVGDAEDVDEDGSILDREVEKVAVSVIEETNTVSSFFEDETSYEPRLVVVESD